MIAASVTAKDIAFRLVCWSYCVKVVLIVKSIWTIDLRREGTFLAPSQCPMSFVRLIEQPEPVAVVIVVLLRRQLQDLCCSGYW